ncbi:hypothetical protein BD779DRAFT_1537395 [Infundibulicybe gibba]|nr:hypothetical protein BD779DRAFT_1537395 [Infundibulicybe gibba]
MLRLIHKEVNLEGRSHRSPGMLTLSLPSIPGHHITSANDPRHGSITFGRGGCISIEDIASHVRLSTQLPRDRGC